MTITRKKDPAAQAADLALAQALARARNSRGLLDKATDQLNAQITAAEKAIVALKLGVSGYVTVETRHEGFVRFLSFEKHSDQWRLTTETGDTANGPSGDVMPLINAPRSVRLLAVLHLRALIEHMIKSMDNEIQAVQAGLASAQQFVESLAEPEPDPFDEPPPPSDEDAPF